ncbi:hypothetical protein [Actinokineospora diospyrosa]|uniref:Uncharacterized protein n=1 Tax=Actinokineospora diospyrosa TaxID=103728 RepID=A0ABT1IKJ3_9PSEU|nr:hypothetical protein [Actinokineospora diospyrosa]MCP2273048.1 hypothetical protein [Actinokineospora diospyrosa]
MPLLRRVVLALLICTVALIAVLLGETVLTATGLTFDPHGYGTFATVLLAATLTPVALLLWLLHRWLR